jgi:hypothetical protein
MQKLCIGEQYHAAYLSTVISCEEAKWQQIDDANDPIDSL